MAQPAPFVLLVTGPSGSGKSTVLRGLLEADPGLEFSVSCTTRPARPGEVDGHDYHFLSREEFGAQRDAGAFVEWAEVHGSLYGTRHADVEATLAAGKVSVLDIDIQGGRNILREYGERVASVFVFAPSWEELERRLRGRATDDEATVQRRLASARAEVAGAGIYRYWLVNDDVERARAHLAAIVAAEAIARSRWSAPPLAP